MGHKVAKELKNNIINYNNASFYSWMTSNRPMVEQTLLLRMGDKTKELSSYSFFGHFSYL